MAHSKKAFFDVVLRWFCFKTDYAAIHHKHGEPAGRVLLPYSSQTKHPPLPYFTQLCISDPSWHIPAPQHNTKLTQKADHGTTTLQCYGCSLLPEQHSLKNCKIFQISRIGGSLKITSASAEMTFLYRTNQLARSSLSLLTSL